ncbi:hypothetical protein H6G54_28440 [Anabaena cylindrica FACHB-243]|uniref:Uncharacterized protein n=1 Tax=Anabaena cylindrica (strain ATCC 27899 / PCC 7122) TaxID=272123 RepID=K9ZQE6_ANACC|nr:MULTISPECIES: hypothetical protein [Anabaena]AFZ61448.1 hypothetical protein Anacy_6179 [Anabaena cylindrica PCC 7122]MBD2421537.1 hypothetical protein [Anabaena cylindrica FACHB-243]MBY5284236.1 hypothetical protein [Anabaena sp. CCAP 1446/1C]MBY5310607.1 hypothetical protein [Anabaena sp. CCAP 1446/1C]MCM2405953.1 hypothetical protein [Anabaena sp. CCAP 1446/1C]
MSDLKKTADIASKLITELHDITDELTIKKATLKYWHEMKKAVSDGNFGRCRTAFRKAILSAFPDRETATPGYYFTNSGKGQVERFEHLSLWYATANEERWNVTGEDARKQYFGGLPELPKSEVTEDKSTVETKPETKPEVITAVEPTPALTLESMQIEALQLDTDTQQKVQDALDYSGMSLADFIQKACTIYATTLTGKAKQFDSDLSGVTTQELLSAKYRTHPGRAREMVKRAIQAIKIHNSEIVSETGDRWHINQTAIQSLTGSKPQTVKEILTDYQDDIDSHNATHELTPYLNRKADKRKIEDVIDVAALVPNGIE